MTASIPPRAWTADEVRADTSWIQRLSAGEVDGFRRALKHAAALDKPLLDLQQADFPAAARRPRRARSRDRDHPGPLGHVPREGLSGRRVERGRDPARLLGHGPAHRRRPHPEPRQPGHQRRARRRRQLQGQGRPRLQHQCRTRLSPGLVRRGRPALPAHRQIGRDQQGHQLDRAARRGAAPAARPDRRAAATLLPQLPGHAGRLAAAVLRLPDPRRRPRALRDAHQPQEHGRRATRLRRGARASRRRRPRHSTCSTR